MNQLFDLSIESYFKNANLINITFYRCSIVIFSIITHCLMNQNKSYESPFNGFVLQAFNFAWLIFALFYLVKKNKFVPKIISVMNKTKKINHLKNMTYTSFWNTSKWNIFGILNGIILTYFFYLHDLNNTKYFTDTLVLIIIVIINIKLFQINGLNYGSVISSSIGILIFLVYLFFTSSVVG